MTSRASDAPEPTEAPMAEDTGSVIGGAANMWATASAGASPKSQGLVSEPPA